LPPARRLARLAAAEDAAPMGIDAIIAIAIFIAVLAGLNRYEYHRFD
jgi:hypothetical protein